MAVIPPRPFEMLPVTCNAWYAMEQNISENRLLKEADAAAEMGVEYFVLDAGWYGGSMPEYSNSENFSTGLGEWVEDKLKFPSGLGKFSDYVRSKGMKFGI